MEGAQAAIDALRVHVDLKWDPRTLGYRAPAYEAATIVDARTVGPPPWPAEDVPAGAWRAPELRPYQSDALTAWRAFAGRGVVVLPTGSGKTRVALAALHATRAPALILCPTRALLEQWRRELATYFSGPIGVVGDGQMSFGAITIMTFESAYRRMDTLGDRFRMLVVDEVHNFGGGGRSECLEMCTAPFRLGLTATAPPVGSAALARLDRLVGPVVCEIGLGELLGTHLSELTIVRLPVELSAEEAEEYHREYAPFVRLRGEIMKHAPGADWQTLVHVLSKSAAGRDALRGFRRAVAISSLPSAKRARARNLLAMHRDDTSLLFTASTDDAYTVAKENLIPVITAETARRERERVLSAFRDGTLRSLVSARVLNEGFDVPEARIAILLGAAMGAREQLQRIGRVLRKAPDKHAVVYELFTRGTVDDRRAQSRRRQLATRCAALR